MKKGKTRIIVGCALLMLQLLTMSSGNAPGIHVGESTELIAYEIAVCLGYYGPGICGLVLLCLGFKAYCSDDKPVMAESVNLTPPPEPPKAPESIVPDASVPGFVELPIPEAPHTYGGDVAKHDTHTIPVEHIVDAAVTEPGKSKQRYCKYCGSAIDPQTKKCSGCGKQYFHIKIRMRQVVTALIIACLIALNIFQFFRFRELSSQDRFYDDIVEALSSDDLGAATNTFKASRNYIIVGADEQDRRFTLTAHELDEESITVSYSSDAASVYFDKDEWKKKVNVEVIPHHPGVTVVTFQNDKNGKSFEVLIIVTE